MLGSQATALVKSEHQSTFIWRMIGVLLLLNFALVAFICTRLGVQEQVWWMSHVALALGGIGLVIGSRLLTATALAGVLVPHSIWMADLLAGFTLGVHPLGVTQYLQGADAWMWLKTLHHFYLVPILLIAVWRGRHYPAELVPAVLVLYAVLTIVSRLLLPEPSNVNSAFAFLPGVRASTIAWTNALPPVNFIVVMNAGAFLLFIMPADMVIRRLIGAPLLGGKQTPDISPAPALPQSA